MYRFLFRAEYLRTDVVYTCVPWNTGQGVHPCSDSRALCLLPIPIITRLCAEPLVHKAKSASVTLRVQRQHPVREKDLGMSIPQETHFPVWRHSEASSLCL